MTEGFSVYITNLSTAEVLRVEDPQNQIIEQIEVSWPTRNPVGASQSRAHFGSTHSKVVGPVLIRYRSRSEADVVAAEDAIAFLQSLCYAADPAAVGVTGSAPPLVQFTWPGSLSLECRITSLKLERTHFNNEGRTLDFDAELMLLADPGTPPDGSDIRRFGSLQ